MPKSVVVLVEDNPMNRLLAVDALERAGFEVADFGNTDEAAAYAECMPESIAALVADIGVPGERDGLDLARVFARDWPDMVVIVTSGLYTERPAELPPRVDFIPKPWTARDLIARVKATVQPAF